MTKKERQFIDDMIRCRGMNFPRLGMIVEVYGDIGTIAGMNDSANLDVVFANQQKYGRHKHNCHPNESIKYFDGEGNLIAAYE